MHETHAKVLRKKDSAINLQLFHSDTGKKRPGSAERDFTGAAGTEHSFCSKTNSLVTSSHRMNEKREQEPLLTLKPMGSADI